jgi:Flp pilus assembly protein TadD
LGRAFGGVGTPSESGTSDAVREVLANPRLARDVIFPELAIGQGLGREDLIRNAEEAENVGRFDEAVRTWGLLVSNRPDDVELRLRFGNALFRSGRTKRAAAEYEAARVAAMDDWEVQYEVGNFHVRVRDRASARMALNQAMFLNPTDVRVLNNLGAVEMEDGNSGRAIQLLEQATELDPTFAAAWLNLALARDNANRPTAEVLEAVETYARLSGLPDRRTERWLRDLRQAATAGR